MRQKYPAKTMAPASAPPIALPGSKPWHRMFGRLSAMVIVGWTERSEAQHGTIRLPSSLKILGSEFLLAIALVGPEPVLDM
jgi:hypothetical protein